MRQILHGILCRKCEYRPIGKNSEINEISQPPFAFFKTTSIFYIGITERYLKKKKECLFLNLLKEPAKRFSDADEDEKLQLASDPKERQKTS
jgi:hypothetical protein